MSDGYAFASIAELGAALRAGSTTSRALTESFLDRLETHGPGLNALVTVTRERALREAERADSELADGIDRGPLHGIPYGAKDLLATRDYPTTWGAEPFRTQHFSENATVVRRLADAGAVLIAKLAMVELAGGFGYEQPNAALTGPGRSAWSRDHWSGGSSSGSGSAVGAGLVPYAIGTETWGSIHCPSSFNGITGLRPTPGRVSRGGAMALSWTMDKIGPMARSAADCARVLNAITGPDLADPISLATPAIRGDERTSGFRFGVLKGCFSGTSDGVAANTRAALDVLRSIGTIEEFALPDLPWDDAASVIIMCEAASAFESFLERGENMRLTASEDRAGIYHALQVPAVDYLKSLRLRAEGAAVMADALAGFDAILAPTYSCPAPPAEGSFEEYFDRYSAPDLGAVGNLLGLPSIAVPTGLEGGLPTSLEILGRWWSEGTLVAIANQFQRATPWHEARPPSY